MRFLPDHSMTEVYDLFEVVDEEAYETCDLSRTNLRREFTVEPDDMAYVVGDLSAGAVIT